MSDIMKIFKPLQNSDILLKGVTKTIQNDIKEQNGNGIGMILGTLGASSLGSLLSGKGLYRSGSGNNKCNSKKGNCFGEGLCRSREGIKKKIVLMPPRPLTNFEAQSYYKNEPRFNAIYSRDNLPKTIKNVAIALYVKNNEVIYFDSFGV